MSLIIDWPRLNKPAQVIDKHKKNILVASGRADPELIGVFGRCQLRSDHRVVIDGLPLMYNLATKKTQGVPHCYHWQIAFAHLSLGEHYRLTVIGLTRDGAQEIAIRDFTVGTRFITIASHDNGDNVTSEADNFQPFGDLNDFPLGDASMTDTSNDVTSPDHTFSDCVDLQFWSAQFPTLGSGTYVLFVEDSAKSSSATVTGLTVD